MFSRFKNILFSNMICLLIPQADLCRPKLMGLVLALTEVVKHVYGVLFVQLVNEVNDRIEITPQVWSLEKALNNRFFSDSLIYIEDGVFKTPLSLFTRPEEKPKTIYTRQEGQPTTINLRSESGFNGVTFRVRIPKTLSTRREEIYAFVDRNKLASKTFEVIDYE